MDLMANDIAPIAFGNDAHRFLQGGGEMGALIRAFDWSLTPLGPPEGWPQSLRTTVRLMLTTNHPMFIFWGPDGTCLYNDGYRQTMGPERHPSALGQPARLVWDEIWDIIGPQIELVMRGEGATWHVDALVPVTRFGRREDVYWTYSYSPIDDEDRVGGVLVVCTDVTPQHNTSQALRESEERLRLAQAAGGIGAFTIDVTTDILTVTDEFCRVFGIQPAPFLDVREIEKIVIDEDQDKVSHPVTRAAMSIPPLTEYRIRRPDTGEVRWIARQGAFVVDEAGKPVQLIGVVQDVTERKRTEETLRRLNEDLEREVAIRTNERDQVWRNSPDLLVVVGGDGVFRAVNPAWSLVLGFQEAELVGHRFDEFIHPQDEAATREALEHTTHNVLIRFENRFRHKDGAYRWFSWMAAPDEEGVVYANGRHITEMKEQAEALARAEEDLRQALKMEAVGQLTGGIAHDFNNLLTGIMGSLDLLSRRIAGGRTDDVARFVETAQASASRAAALTHRLLAFSRRQSLDARPLTVNRLVAGMEELLTRTLGEQIVLELALEDGLWTAEADANQLENAVLNLAINARDAMPYGGRLSITTANVHLDAAETLRQEGLFPGEYVTISVGDTGVGMTPEVIARAFDPFFTTKPIGAGTGLGLSMVYGFAKQSRGHVRIDSEQGQGVVVTLYLPRYVGEPQSAEDPGTDIGRRSVAGGKIVLVVEDDAAVRMLVTEVVGELGLQAVVAEDAPQALPMLNSDQPIDLLVTDVGLPGMNGRQLADAARQLRPGLKVLFITGYVESAAERADFLTEGMSMLTKPFAMQALAEKLRDLIE
jgi:PAS domain S-box-containing protein